MAVQRTNLEVKGLGKAAVKMTIQYSKCIFLVFYGSTGGNAPIILHNRLYKLEPGRVMSHRKCSDIPDVTAI